MKLNSVIFHTGRLSELREFYEGKLQLSIGTYVKDNQTVQDCSDSYVNYYLGESLLCFEEEKERTDIGTIILSVPDFKKYKSEIESGGVQILKSTDRYFKIKDPEGRSILIEAET